MPTLNSGGTIRLSLDSIARQTYEKSLVEILVIDGGSNDDTRIIAKEFNCLILDNPAVQPEYAKALGLTHATGKYAVFLDSDEVLCDADSLRKKIRLLEAHPEVKNVITAGLRNPPGYPAINDYANRFGEPFSFFMYRLDGGDYVRSLKACYETWYEDNAAAIFGFKANDALPICDGGGHCFDLSYLKRIEDVANVGIVPVIFHRMAKETARLAVIKGDYTLHYSTASLKRYVSKLNWRVMNNIYGTTGTEGFVNRDRFHPKWFRVKKFLFIPYALSLVGPLYDAAVLAVSREKPTFLLHFPLTIYTALLILLQLLLKGLGFRPAMKNYGE